MSNHNRNHDIAMNGPSLKTPDWDEQDDDTLSIKEALQNIVDSAVKDPGSDVFYYMHTIDFNNAVRALEKEKGRKGDDKN